MNKFELTVKKILSTKEDINEFVALFELSLDYTKEDINKKYFELLAEVRLSQSRFLIKEAKKALRLATVVLHLDFDIRAGALLRNDPKGDFRLFQQLIITNPFYLKAILIQRPLKQYKEFCMTTLLALNAKNDLMKFELKWLYFCYNALKNYGEALSLDMDFIKDNIVNYDELYFLLPKAQQREHESIVFYFQSLKAVEEDQQFFKDFYRLSLEDSSSYFVTALRKYFFPETDKLKKFKKNHLTYFLLSPEFLLLTGVPFFLSVSMAFLIFFAPAFLEMATLFVVISLKASALYLWFNASSSWEPHYLSKDTLLYLVLGLALTFEAIGLFMPVQLPIYLSLAVISLGFSLYGLWGQYQVHQEIANINNTLNQAPKRDLLKRDGFFSQRSGICMEMDEDKLAVSPR